jgi:hypothetical protein
MTADECAAFSEKLAKASDDARSKGHDVYAAFFAIKAAEMLQLAIALQRIEDVKA